MKDLIIKKESIRREIIIWISSFILALAFNTLAIVKYKSDWGELLTQIHIVFLVSLIFYLITVLARLGFNGIRRIISSFTRKIK